MLISRLLEWRAASAISRLQSAGRSFIGLGPVGMQRAKIEIRKEEEASREVVRVSEAKGQKPAIRNDLLATA